MHIAVEGRIDWDRIENFVGFGKRKHLTSSLAWKKGCCLTRRSTQT
jgi:hypothetical protein